MMKSIRVGVAALAFAGLVTQPMVANACRYEPPSHAANAWGVAWAIGFFLCDGMITGMQEKQAKAHHTTVSGHDRAAGVLACIFPPLGLAKIDKQINHG